MKSSKMIIESLKKDWDKKLSEHVKIYEELTVSAKIDKEEKDIVSVGLKLLDKEKNSYVITAVGSFGAKIKRDCDGKLLVVSAEKLEKDFERR